ncbi:xylulokinase [[Eubacterium] cellulosolvens]
MAVTVFCARYNFIFRYHPIPLSSFMVSIREAFSETNNTISLIYTLTKNVIGVIYLEKEYVIAFDSGTQSVKTIIFDKNGNILGEGHSPHTISTPEPTRAEQNPNEWWEAFCNSLRTALKNSKISTDKIAAVGITNQRETMCAVNSKGNPLIPAHVWYDARSLNQVRWIKNVFGAEKYLAITGRMPDTTWWAQKIMWVRDNEKEIFNSVFKFLTVHGFFVYKLTGEFKDSFASPTGILDMKTLTYSKELLDAFDIPRVKLCDLVPPGVIIGYVSNKAAKETGLKPGTPVVAGAGDQQAGGLGAGLTQPGTAYLNLGTSVVLGIIASQYHFHQNFFVREGCIPNTWNFEALINGGYWMVTWYKQNFGHIEVEAATSLNLPPEIILDHKAEEIPAGSLGLIVQPYWLGVRQPYWDEKARGTIIGWNDTHTRIHLYRAIIEGIAYEIRLNFNGLEDALTSRINDIRVFGGGAKSNLSCQIIADVVDRPVRRVKTPEATTLGAAILAASGVGLHPTVKEAAEFMTQISTHFDPKKENTEIYSRFFKGVYKNLYPTVQAFFSRL